MTEDIEATPAAQAAAEEAGVDLSTVEGTGSEGRITKADVEAAASVETDPFLPDRDQVASKMPATRHPGDSGDPLIQQMIANRHAHHMMGDKDAVKALDQKLRDLGYEVAE